MSESPDAKARRQMRAKGWQSGESPHEKLASIYNHRKTRGATAARARELGGVPLFRDTMNAFFRATRPRP